MAEQIKGGDDVQKLKFCKIIAFPLISLYSYRWSVIKKSIMTEYLKF